RDVYTTTRCPRRPISKATSAMCCPTLAGSGTNVWLSTRRVLRSSFAITWSGPASPWSLLAGHLIVDPAVGLLHAVAEAGVGLPAEELLDQRVVTIAAVHALGGRQVVVPLQLD